MKDCIESLNAALARSDGKPVEVIVTEAVRGGADRAVEMFRKEGVLRCSR